MSHRKQPSNRKLAAALGAAGLSLSLAGGISAASAAPTADMPTRNTGASHEITLCEEEVSDVSLATFHVFDTENPGTFRRRVKLAQGCGGCGCGVGGGCVAETQTSTYCVAWPVGRYGYPPRYSTKTPRKYPKVSKRRHVSR